MPRHIPVNDRNSFNYEQPHRKKKEWCEEWSLVRNPLIRDTTILQFVRNKHTCEHYQHYKEWILEQASFRTPHFHASRICLPFPTLFMRTPDTYVHVLVNIWEEEKRSYTRDHLYSNYRVIEQWEIDIYKERKRTNDSFYSTNTHDEPEAWEGQLHLTYGLVVSDKVKLVSFYMKDGAVFSIRQLSFIESRSFWKHCLNQSSIINS